VLHVREGTHAIVFMLFKLQLSTSRHCSTSPYLHLLSLFMKKFSKFLIHTLFSYVLNVGGAPACREKELSSSDLSSFSSKLSQSEQLLLSFSSNAKIQNM